MNPSRRRALAAIGAAGLGASGLLSPGRQALAQKPWPERPINYIVPFPPGGLTDVAARQVGKALGDAERWNVVVENKPGGAANIGAAHVSHAAPDGHTWLAITLSHAANATLFAGRAGYDLIRDLTRWPAWPRRPSWWWSMPRATSAAWKTWRARPAPNSCRRVPAATARRRT